MAKYFKILFIVVLLTPAFGWDFFGLFKKKEAATTPMPETTTSLPFSSTTTEADNGACWWTQCGTRCTATASVHDFNGVNCNPGQYKFRCCSS